jgi:hypothetical protein
VALRPFKPGQSGNPGGRPKGDIELRRAARGRTAEALETLINIMRNQKAPAAARVTAAEAILSRGWGKPVQPTAFTDVDGNDRPLSGDGELLDDPIVKARRIAFLLAEGLRALPAKQPELEQASDADNGKTDALSVSRTDDHGI